MSIRIMTAVWDHGPDQPHLRLLLLALADNANDQGVCWPSLDLLARKCAVDPRSVRRNLRALEAGGWIVSTMRTGQSTSYTVRTPDAHVPPDAGVRPVASVLPTPDAHDTPTPDAGVRTPRTPVSPEPSENHQGNRQVNPQTEPEGFSAFWSAYPRKVGKGAARKSWTKAVRGTHWSLIVAAASAYADHHRARQTEPRYIANPATWLNQERWDDDLPEVTGREAAQAAEQERLVADRTGFTDHWRAGGGF